MRVSDAERILSLYGYTRRRVEAISTELRKVGFLPSGGRGLYAPHISCRTAAHFMLAVAGAERIADAVEMVLSTKMHRTPSGLGLIETLERAICRPDEASKVAHVLVFPIPGKPFVEIAYRNGNLPRRFFTQEVLDTPDFAPNASGHGYTGLIGYVGGGVLEQFAIAMSEPEDGEIVG